MCLTRLTCEPTTYPQTQETRQNRSDTASIAAKCVVDPKPPSCAVADDFFAVAVPVFGRPDAPRQMSAPGGDCPGRSGSGRVGNNSTEHVGLLQRGTARGAERSRTPTEPRHLRSTVGFADLVKVLLLACRRREGRLRRR